MTSFVSSRLELTGILSGTVAEAAIAAGASLQSYHDTVDAFADAVALANDHWDSWFMILKTRLWEILRRRGIQRQPMKVSPSDMHTGANGTLVTDGVLSVSLFNTAHEAVGVDDPGIASHTGNNADRGFNMTVSGSHLEVLPMKTQLAGHRSV